jgi:hypothetical protein
MSLPAGTRQGLAILAAAVAFGVVADALGRLVPGRLDAALGLGTLVLALIALAQSGHVSLPASLMPLGLPLTLLGVALIWRDSPTLFALNLAGVGTVAALASPRLRAVGRRVAGLSDYAVGAAQLAGAGAAGAARLLFTDIDWSSLPVDSRARRARGTAVGLAAAVPVAAVFGGLLMKADPVFERLVSRAFALDVDPLLSHLSAILLWTWLAAGVLRLICRSGGAASLVTIRGGRLGLGEVGSVLVVVDLLFLAFVVVQFRYLFGGADLVRGVTGMSYAEYARRGFFELVAVAALSLPLLLVGDWALDQRDPERRRRFRALAGLMLLLLDVMLASALIRMRLYTAEYGLTELRFYTTAFMGWLVLVFGWFGATVLRGRRERFGTGALLAGWLVLAALNLLNPDAIIAGVNLARAGAGRPLDPAYAAELSADALPTFSRMLPRMSTPDACVTAGALNKRWQRELATRNRWTIGLVRAPRASLHCADLRPDAAPTISSLSAVPPPST